MALPNGTAKRWIRAQLLSDATITSLIGQRVYQNGAVPQGAVMPYVIYQYMGGNALNKVGAVRLWNDDLWLVKCVGLNAHLAVIEQVANRVDDLLSFGRGSNSQGTIVVAEHERPVEFPEPHAEGITYQHLGAEYRIKIQSGVVA